MDRDVTWSIASKMSERPSRHQRRPSQSVILSFSGEDLSALPLSDVAGDKFAPPSNQPRPPPQQIRSPLPPVAAATPAPEMVAKDDKKVTDVAH
ncbi:hypothetical protein GH714_013058 [Hevea brasiliensis]|uniref:Uncharacterized protein n=1 Tax=Hevea brasiliensis TaxID=3981 RepID=A0A6A6LYP1_HEVBR|nr:hypothetical protein GH714_013058 [Hevea brasiliensis]